MIQTGIRRYTLGKFEQIVDAVVYSASLDGWEEAWFGDGDIGYYASLVPVPSAADAQTFAQELGYCLNYEEVSYLLHYSHAIVSSDSQGFVYVEYFETEDEARDSFQIREESFYIEYAEFYDGAEY